MLKGSLLRRPRSDFALFNPIQAFIAVLVICKYEYDPIKNVGARVLTALNIHFSNAHGQLTQ